MTRADWILLLTVVALLPLLYLQLWGPGGVGERVRILAPGQKPVSYSLTKDRTVDVAGAVGISTIKIHNGEARFIASPCHGKYCIHSGWHTHAGEVAACLPNRISLEIIGANRRYDSINF